MKFLVDCMLGRLAKGLRMLGYDTIYYRGEDPHQLIQLARQEGRVILTRNTKLIPKRSEDRIVKVSEDKSLLQLRELIQKGYISFDGENLFSRCLICNTLLDEIPREEVQGRVPDFIFYQQRKFFQCPQCRRIYWQGSHQKNMGRRIEELFENKTKER
jgi:uncharacterized protein with PIN domain